MVKPVYAFSSGRLGGMANTIVLETPERKRHLPVEQVPGLSLFGEVDLNKRFLKFAAPKGHLAEGGFQPTGVVAVPAAAVSPKEGRRVRPLGMALVGVQQDLQDLGPRLQDLAQKELAFLPGHRRPVPFAEGPRAFRVRMRP